MTKTPCPSTAALQAFESAARHGSFTRAAIELNVTQGAISRQVRQLEQLLGASLFQRIRQRVVLTDAGRRYREDVRRMLVQLEVATKRTMAYASAGSVVTLAVTPTFSSTWLARRLPRFLEAHPAITLNCFMWLPRTEFGVEQFDAAIHLGPPRWPEAHARELIDSDLWPMCSPAYRAAHRIRAQSDLPRTTLLHEINRPTAWADWFAAEGLPAAEASRGPRFELLAMLTQAAVASIGVALLPACLTERERETGALTMLPSRGTRREEPYYFVVPDTKRENPSVRLFEAWLLQEARAMNAPSRRAHHLKRLP